MLVVVSSMRKLPSDLFAVYDFPPQEEEEFRDYLREVFFKTEGAVYCLWQVDSGCVSALRLEPYRDGMVLAGLETAAQERKMGYATILIQAAMEWAKCRGVTQVYSHIHHGNTASIKVHQRCGFQKVADHAKLLDGTVTAALGTYLLKIHAP